ncbi:hypothetical protein STRDD10_01931 [Streptococcus sp. DD10]|nr:LPXTG cell wall anchor domain-containing protein [Streptococcus sp. DD10]KXT72442.1 hypothetical protein STRDD10_01931 [Streptococcus sp. DD10]
MQTTENDKGETALLPQTGEKSGDVALFAGLISLGLAGLGFVPKKRID